MDKFEQVKAKLEEMKAKYVLEHDEEEEDLLGYDGYLWWSGFFNCLKEISFFVDTLDVKESDETAEAFARIIRANLIGIDKDVQYKFEQLYKEITGKKMYQ